MKRSADKTEILKTKKAKTNEKSKEPLEKRFDLHQMVERAKKILLEEYSDDIYGTVNLKVLKCETTFNVRGFDTTSIYMFNYCSEPKIMNLGCVLFSCDHNDDESQGEVLYFRTFDLNFFERSARATIDAGLKRDFHTYEEFLPIILMAEDDLKIKKDQTQHRDTCLRPVFASGLNLPIFTDEDSKTQDFVCPFCLASVDIIFE